MKRLINLSFIPGSADCGLLLLRIWFGLTIFLNHGLAKFQNFGATVTNFQEKMGIPPVFGAAAVIAESVCAVLIVMGLATRLAATFLAITMAVAFVKAHGMALSGPNPGELAFVYLGAFIALILAGAGRFSLDEKLLK